MFITTIKKTTPKTTYLDLFTHSTQNNTTIFQKITYLSTNFQPNITQQAHIQQTEKALENIDEILKPFRNNYQDQYYEFKIPKHSGGLRTINAPLEDFKTALSNVKNIFENKIKCLPHPAAYAYIKNTSIYDAVQVHQQNNSKWFLKIDLKNFFPSCTPELIYNQLINLYPFHYISEEHKTILKDTIQICCLNNGLPQGTPMSPILTNLIMVSYDYYITMYLNTQATYEFKYTRYADDILISSPKNFNWRKIQKNIEKILTPFTINKEKLRYGNSAGRNWNLGLMLNKDNNITLGYKKKKLLNAMLNNFFRDYKNNIKWSIPDTQHLIGQLSYLKYIEPDYYKYILNKYETKYNFNFKQLIKIILNPTHI